MFGGRSSGGPGYRDEYEMKKLAAALLMAGVPYCTPDGDPCQWCERTGGHPSRGVAAIKTQRILGEDQRA